MDNPQHSPTGLLLDDDGDTPVPLGAGQLNAVPAGSPPAEPAAPDGPLTFADAEPAIRWATSPQPSMGLRALLFAVTGIDVGLCARERELRRSMCALYRAALSTYDPER